MENSEDTRRTHQFERIYTLLLLWLVAGLLLISILYTSALWWVKVLIASVLIIIGAIFAHSYWRER